MPLTNTNRVHNTYAEYNYVAALLKSTDDVDILQVNGTDVRTEGVFAATLFLICAHTFGEGLINGEYGAAAPGAIATAIKNAYAVSLPPENLGKIMAAISVITTDNLTRSLPSFLATIHGLLGDGIDWSYEEPIDVDDLAWALMEATLLYPPEEDTKYDDQIVGYIQLMLAREGIKSPPAILAFAADEDGYANIGQYDEDVLKEQAGRTDEINRYIEQMQDALMRQIASIPSLNVTADLLTEAINSELVSIARKDKWM
jgi:hypothetical protein